MADQKNPKDVYQAMDIVNSFSHSVPQGNQFAFFETSQPYKDLLSEAAQAKKKFEESSEGAAILEKFRKCISREDTTSDLDARRTGASS